MVDRVQQPLSLEYESLELPLVLPTVVTLPALDMDLWEEPPPTWTQPRRVTYGRIPDVVEMPTLIQVQLESYRWFREEGLRELFEEISPIVSFNQNLELHFLDYRFDEAKYSEKQCRDMDMTYAAPLWVKVQLVNRDTGEIQEQEVFMGDFPLMTENGTFVVNGAERVVVSQLIRSPGVYFTVDEDRVTGRQLCLAKLIPNRGAWMEFETKKRDDITVKVDRKRKIPVTVVLRALGVVEDGTGSDIIREGTDEELLAIFEDVEADPWPAVRDRPSEHAYIAATIEREGRIRNAEEGAIEFYKKMRPGDPPTLQNARNFLENLLFNPRRYDLGRVGRYKLNKHLGLDLPLSHRTLTKEDLIRVVRHMIRVNNGVEGEDDIDHLGNRRVKTVGELLQNQMRIGLLRMERVVRERMSIRDPDQVTPTVLINIRPVTAATREFFGGSQLSQFMDQTNPLSELTHKRTLSALGPGGLRRERAGFDVRDVHHSHYGRICPIETPEGPNIGLIGRLATFADVNELGFIETPYRRVIRAVPNEYELLLDRTLREDVVDPISGELIAEAGTVITPQLAERIVALPEIEVRIRPVATNEIVYLSADEEERYTVAHASVELNDRGEFVRDRVSVRRGEQFVRDSVQRVDFMDVSPKQIVGVSAALIPFLEHDDANRALMGSNMQRQGVPLITPEAPIVGTGMERHAALDSGQVVVAEQDGEVVSVTSDRIVVAGPAGEKADCTAGSAIGYRLRKYGRSNQSTCIDQRPLVGVGDFVRRGQPIADSSSTDQGELALGQNVLVAFMSWEGSNYEDAVVISDSVLRDDKFTSIHIEKHEAEARDTKLGPEEITRDIPNVGEDALRNLDEDGIIRIGAEVRPGDILVGKITPKGETDLTPEEKLLRAIFGEKAREVKDSSLRLPHGERGKVIDIKAYTREEHSDLSAGVDKLVRVSVAQQRKLTEGDKMAGRHGNKGVISKVVPAEDMPHLADGTPIEIILNPLGVPARMNIGQILETHLGWAAHRLGIQVNSPVFDGAKEEQITAELARAWLMDRAWHEVTERAWDWLKSQEYPLEELAGDDEARQLYLSHWLGTDDVLNAQDSAVGFLGVQPNYEAFRSDPAYARRLTLEVWLRELGIDDAQDYLPDQRDGTFREARTEADARARSLCLRLWCQDRGYGADSDPCPKGQGSALADAEVPLEAVRISQETGCPLPTSGKMILYDGKTGEPFDRPVTVGIIYIMKLAHLVEDKVHARSTGPYSLVTQQPLGGKAQFGGQRFGEMEVWALEAYGAAYTLQEMLTVKSDDVAGRVKAYEAIVKGEKFQEPGAPESFLVLVKELQSLGLSVEVLNEKGEVIELFGKDERDDRPIRLGWGLGLPRPRRRRRRVP